MASESEKILERSRQELLDLHKRVLLNYLIAQGLESRVYRKFFAIYDQYINTKNIQKFFPCPCKIFVRALLLDKLDMVEYMSKPVKKRKKNRKTKKVIKF